MSDKNWKRTEREICKQLNAERSGPTGRDNPDCTEDTHPFSVEIKHGKDFPKYLTSMLKQSTENAYPGTTPIVIIHPEGADIDDSLVFMSFESFKEVYEWVKSYMLE